MEPGRCGGPERFDLSRDSEKLAQEILDVRRQLDDQFGLLLGRAMAWIGAGLDQTRVEIRVGSASWSRKTASRRTSPSRLIQILEEDAEA